MQRTSQTSQSGRSSYRGGALTVVAALLAAATAVSVGVVSARNAAVASRTTSSRLDAPPSAVELMGVLARLQLTPRLLAAVGFTAGETSTLVGNARTHLDSRMGALRTLEAEINLQRRECDALRVRVQSGQASAQERTAYEAALAACAASDSALAQHLAATRSAALTAVQEDRRAALELAGDNMAGHDVPTQYLFSSRTEAEWVRLRNALANQRIALNRGQEPDQWCIALLASCNAEAATAAAVVNLSANLQAVTEAWETAAGAQ